MFGFFKVDVGIHVIESYTALSEINVYIDRDYRYTVLSFIGTYQTPRIRATQPPAGLVNKAASQPYNLA